MSFESLAIKFCPNLYLHSHEVYNPCEINWLLSKSTLMTKKDNAVKRIKESPLTQRDIWEYSQQNHPNEYGRTDVWIDFKGEMWGQSELDKVPIYAHIKQLDERLIRISYMMIYAYNGAKKVMGFVPVGFHWGDVEHVTIEVDIEKQSITKMFFGAHTTLEGRWVDAKDLEFEDTHPVVYIAVNSHATYPKEGIIVRFGCFGNDETNSHGKRWVPKVEFVYDIAHEKFNPDKHGWIAFCGRIGFDGVSSAKDKDYFIAYDPITTKPPPICCTIM